jgi:predicted phosphohydrolase
MNMPGIYAISDPHLPVDVQVSKYHVPSDYFQHLHDFLAKKKPEILLIAGDLIWGSEFPSVQHELELIRKLPGKYKFFIEGNHDLWVDHLGSNLDEARQWMYEKYSTPDFYYLSGRAFIVSVGSVKIGLCGAQGFAYDQNKTPTDVDKQRRDYELQQLDRALTSLRELTKKNPTQLNICLIHYPPTVSVFEFPRKEDNEFFNRIRASGIIHKIVYGHVHIEKDLKVFCQNAGVELYCASIDRNNYEGIKIFDEFSRIGDNSVEDDARIKKQTKFCLEWPDKEDIFHE